MKYPFEEPDLGPGELRFWLYVAVGVPVMFWAFAVIFTVIRLVGS